MHNLNIVYLKKIHNFLQWINLRLSFYHKELAEEFEGQFTCLGENAEKYITFSVPIEKKITRIVKNGDKITKTLSYILIFIDSARFMGSSSSNLNNNFPKGIYKIKSKYGHNKKNCKRCGIKYKDYECCLAFSNVNNNLIKVFVLQKNIQKSFNKNLKKDLLVYKFANYDISKFILLLQKDVYLYEYMGAGIFPRNFDVCETAQNLVFKLNLHKILF